MKRGKRPHHAKHKTIDDEKKRWHTTPLGIRILVIYTSFLALLYLLFGLTIPTNIFFGSITFGTWARILNLIFFAVLLATLTGLLMKKHWAGITAAGFFIFEIINITSSFIIRFNIMKNAFIIITSAAIITLNSIILWYLYEKREYFTDLRHFKSGKADKIFITAILSLAIMLIISTAAYAATMYTTTISKTNKIIYEIEGMTKEQAMFYCSGQQGEEKDICYLVSAAAYKDSQKETCSWIDNTFYRITCMQAVIVR